MKDFDGKWPPGQSKNKLTARHYRIVKSKHRRAVRKQQKLSLSACAKI